MYSMATTTCYEEWKSHNLRNISLQEFLQDRQCPGSVQGFQDTLLMVLPTANNKKWLLHDHHDAKIID